MTRPALSVVVVSFNAPGILQQCLDALVADARGSSVEILVVRAAGRAISDSIRRTFAAVTVVDADAAATVPRMRSVGLEASSGEIVALIEDDCVVASGWCAAAMTAHATPDLAIGGAVEPGTYRRGLDWGVYFCEYARFMLPLPHDSHGVLAGNNVTYKRAALARLPPAWTHDGFYDVFAHAQWWAEGLPIRNEQTLVVTNMNSWSARHLLSVPFHHGRAFAGQRYPDWRASSRLAVAVLALFLPVLKVARIIREAVQRRRLVGRVLLTLPWIVTFTACWSAGECVGYLSGPGDSPSRWR